MAGFLGGRRPGNAASTGLPQIHFKLVGHISAIDVSRPLVASVRKAFDARLHAHR